MKSGFKRTINWNKYQCKGKNKEQNRYFKYLVDQGFLGVNRLFILTFENNTDRKLHTKYYIPKVEIKEQNIITDGRNFFNQPIKNNVSLIWVGFLEGVKLPPLFKTQYNHARNLTLDTIIMPETWH